MNSRVRATGIKQYLQFSLLQFHRQNAFHIKRGRGVGCYISTGERTTE